MKLPLDKPNVKNIRGQALLLVLLSMSVVLTVAFSILSKSITDISITSKDEDSLRAFSAAEAGIERALATSSITSPISLGNNSTATIAVTDLETGSDRQYLSQNPLLSGETFLFWFVNHDSNGNIDCKSDPSQSKCFKGKDIDICWGNPGTLSNQDDTPAIEAAVVYLDPVWNNPPQSFAGAKTARVAIDPNSTRRGINSFSSHDGTCSTIDGVDLAFKKTIDLNTLLNPSNVYNSNQGGLMYLTLKLFYNSATAHLVGLDLVCPSCSQGDRMPVQGLKIVSSGTSGEANRRLEAIKTFGEPPSIFDAAVFSAGGLSK